MLFINDIHVNNFFSRPGKKQAPGKEEHVCGPLSFVKPAYVFSSRAHKPHAPYLAPCISFYNGQQTDDKTVTQVEEVKPNKH